MSSDPVERALPPGLEGLLHASALDVVRMIGAWSIPVLILDDEGRIRSWNRGAVKLYDRSEEDAIGRLFGDVVGEWPDFEPDSIPGTRTVRYETRHRTRDGALLDVMVTRTDLTGPERHIQGSVVLILDLTSSKALERKLARRVSQLSVVREIGECLQSAMSLSEILRTILVGATAGQGLRFNRAFLLLVDERRGELRARDAVGPSDPQEAMRIWSELDRREAGLKDLLRDITAIFDEGAGGRIGEICRALRVPLDASDHILIRAVHSTSPLRVERGIVVPGEEAVDPELTSLLGTDSFAAVPLKAETGPVGLLVADNVITGRRIEDEEVAVLELLGMQAALAIERAHLTEALEEKVQSLEAATKEIRDNQDRLVRAERLSAIGEMAARVAHEIRNPLVAIGGFARSLLRSVGREDPKRESLEIIVDEVRRLEAIVREVLDYSRPSPPRLARVATERLVSEAIELLRWEMEAAGVRAAVEAPAELPAARADRDQLFQALVNVLRNAIHAMPRGGRIVARLKELPGGIEIAVEDSGVGMSPEVKARIFEPFYTTKPAGSGLGLTIAAQIVRDHQGETRVESREGEGTTVYMRIPAHEGEEDHGEDPGR